MTEREKFLHKMRHKSRNLKKLVEDLELAVIDEDDYNIANVLYWVIEEVKNDYKGMEIK